MSCFTRYVLMVVFDPKLTYTVAITKKKGPAFLLGKVCFPGGKVEDGESALHAAAREMREETGLHVPLEAWKQVDYIGAEHYELTTFAAVTDALFQARTCESEPVWQLKLASHLQFARSQPNQYAPDFLDSLDKALSQFQLDAVC